MSIKKILKSQSWLRRPVKKLKVHIDYSRDARFISAYLLDQHETAARREYKTLLLVHSIEKGLVRSPERPFGFEKAEELIKLLDRFTTNEREGIAFKMGTEVLQSWAGRFLEKGWPLPRWAVEKKISVHTEKPLAGTIRAGAKQITERPQWHQLDYASFIKSRHSARVYDKSKVSDEELLEALELAGYSPSACNRQMIRMHIIDEPKLKRTLYDTLHGTGGINFENCRLGLITFDGNSLEFSGERNQGYLNAGLFAMTLVHAFHWKGIGSCFLQFANTFSEERMLSKQLGLPKNEKIVVAISLGRYVQGENVPSSLRRMPSTILRIVS